MRYYLIIICLMLTGIAMECGAKESSKTPPKFRPGQSDKTCLLKNELDIACQPRACTDEKFAVCGKVALTGVQCITTPCPTDSYQTVTNACQADNGKVWLAFEGECGLLENKMALHLEPVYIAPLDKIKVFHNPFKIKSSQIQQDILTIVFQVSGGCGIHDFDLIIDRNHFEKDRKDLPYHISYISNDRCESLMDYEQQFDLAPILAMFRQKNPAATGEQKISLDKLGQYQFKLPPD